MGPLGGDVIGRQLDRYIIEAPLGSGASGVVYRAKHAVLGREVAIKVLSPEMGGGPEGLARFLAEARAAASVGSPHIVEVLDGGTLPDGTAFLVMELLEGSDLQQHLAAEGRLAPADALAVARQVLAALELAHERGIVHRDLKPANIFIAKDAGGRLRIKLLDFGSSKVRSDGVVSALTRPGQLLGEPHYVAPEQFRRASDADERADVYSVSVILHEMLSGRRPFDGVGLEAMEALAARVQNERAPPLRTVSPDVPPGVAALVDQGLMRDVRERWQSAKEMRLALEDVARSALAVDPDSGVVPLPDDEPTSVGPRPTFDDPRDRRPAPAPVVPRPSPPSVAMPRPTPASPSPRPAFASPSPAAMARRSSVPAVRLGVPPQRAPGPAPTPPPPRPSPGQRQPGATDVDVWGMTMAPEAPTTEFSPPGRYGERLGASPPALVLPGRPAPPPRAMPVGAPAAPRPPPRPVGQTGSHEAAGSIVVGRAAPSALRAAPRTDAPPVRLGHAPPHSPHAYAPTGYAPPQHAAPQPMPPQQQPAARPVGYAPSPAPSSSAGRADGWEVTWMDQERCRASWKNVLIVIERGEVTRSVTMGFAEDARRLAKRVDGRIGILELVGRGASAGTEAAKQMTAAMWASVDGHTRAVAHVVEGHDVWAKAQRTLMADIIMFACTAHPHRIFEERQDGARWLASQLGGLDAYELMEVVDQVRKTYGRVHR